MAPSKSKRSPFTRKQADILRAVYHLHIEQRSALLKKANPALVRRICECSLNLLSGTVPLKKKHKDRLRKHVNLMRKLADPKLNLPSKRRLIVKQTGGGFVPTLLAPTNGSVLASRVAK